MASPEDEIKDLKQKNTELVQKLQFCKMTIGQLENEKLCLLKETNELRLKLNRYRNHSNMQVEKLGSVLQSGSEKALSLIVQASKEIARTMELAKTYMRDQEELKTLPRWSMLGGTPKTNKTDRIHRVPPMMLGGRSIQPVVELTRTIVNNNNTRPTSTVSNRRDGSIRAVPLHLHNMLQDLYIPLTRIDANAAHSNSLEAQSDSSMDEEEDQILEEDDNMHSDINGFNELEEGLDAVVEESEPEDNVQSNREELDAVVEESERGDNVQSNRNIDDNPLEGPSWLLDAPVINSPRATNFNFTVPDSTTKLSDRDSASPPDFCAESSAVVCESPVGTGRVEFTPTVRRRKRPRTPTRSPPEGNTGRVLKVMVAKMPLDADKEGRRDDSVSPPKRAHLSQSPLTHFPRSPLPHIPHFQFDAPSPNGATDAGVIVLEETPGLPSKIEFFNVNTLRRKKSKERIKMCNIIDREIDGNQDSIQIDNRNDDRIKIDTVSKKKRERKKSKVEKGQDEERAASSSTANKGNGRKKMLSDKKGEENSELNQVAVEVNCEDNASEDNESVDKTSERMVSQDNNIEENASVSSLVTNDSDSNSGTELLRGRSRRNRKAVQYKEKPLNVKLRR